MNVAFIIICFKKYSILTLKDRIHHIKQLCDQNKFIENEDYRLAKVSGSASKGGCTHKNEYYLYSIAFKMCLIIKYWICLFPFFISLY